MELYASPLSCSMATKIALKEIDENAVIHNVTLSTKKVADGRDFWGVNPKGLVPALVTREGALLTEGPAVLQYVADLKPEKGLAPRAGTFARYELQQWLNYIATEIHKTVFAQIFNPNTPPASKDFARTVAPAKLKIVEDRLTDREFLLDGFTVADAYLATVLNWCAPAGVSLDAFPALKAYSARMNARPSVAAVLGEDLKLAGRA